MKHAFKLSAVAVMAALSLAACKGESNSAASAPAAASGVPAGLETTSKQVNYIFGYQLGEQLRQVKQNGAEIDLDAIMKGINDQLDAKPAQLSDAQIHAAMETFEKEMQAKAEQKANENLAAGEKFLTENKAKEGVKTTASGLQYKVGKEGSGAAVADGDVALIEYKGTLINGEVFDSTELHGGEPAAFPVLPGTVIPGFHEGLKQMKEGGEYTLYIPAKLAYGAAGNPKIPGNSVLVFDVKVVKVEKGAAAKAAKAAPKK